MTVDASLISAAAVAKHVEMLAEKVFQVDTKWPHFRLLLKDLARLADELPVGSKVVGMERTLLYGGISLAAPVFHRHEYVSFDGSPDSADVRGAYNAAMVDDPRTIRIALYEARIGHRHRTSLEFGRRRHDPEPHPSRRRPDPPFRRGGSDPKARTGYCMFSSRSCANCTRRPMTSSGTRRSDSS